MRKKTWEAAVEILHETNNPAVMYGDAGILDKIHERAGLKEHSHPIDRWKVVLANLSKNPGVLVAGSTLSGFGKHERRVRIFWLPEHAPKQIISAGVE